MNPETPTAENADNEADTITSSEQSNSQPTAPVSVDGAPATEEISSVVSDVAEGAQSQDIASSDQSQASNSDDTKQKFNFDTIGARRLTVAVGVLVVLSVLWYFSNQQMQKLRTAPLEQSGVTITVSDDKEQGTVTIIEQSSQAINSSTNSVVSANMTLVKAYYLNSKSNPNFKDCSKVALLEKQTERKYSSQIINTMRGLLEPLTAEQQSAGWSSAIPAGVLLKSVMIRDGGVAEANFTGNLKRVVGSCAVTAVRTQIEQTLKQFPGVKSVRICIDGNCNQSQILQP